MDFAQPLLAALDLIMREAALFAAVGFLLLGLSDLAVDTIWIGRALWRRARGATDLCLADLPAPTRPGRIAIFTPAWDEADVIGDMLRNTLRSFDHGDYRIYVGCYPNDPATIAEVRRVADPRVRLVVGTRLGPTTKADCLNRLWEAMLADECAEGAKFKAVVLHDAEDVVHPAELCVFDSMIERYDLVQLPVRPLIDPSSRWIAGHYADEFSESHAKEMVVREALGAALPSAGVGCAFAREALARIAAGGAPFDADSLTEDYELGLKLAAAGGTATFLRLRDPDGRLVATEEYFPPTMTAAVSQKARWVTGIALSGWDRLGWRGGLAERWMRLRDRQSVLAALCLGAGYASFAFWALLKLPEAMTDWAPQPIAARLALILQINLAMLGWRLAMRFGFVAQAYGWREGLRSIPRVLVGNVISIRAAWRALVRYREIRGSGVARWHKTAHAFPASIPAE
ncbi:MAG: glycosyl transferase family protein [Pseudomonadota bacterium]|nr:glycosyl transferase family protein [Pseudomonadota bacterium]